MGKFNTNKTKSVPDTITYEGGAAYSRDSLQAWFNMLMSSFVEDMFYESSDSQVKRFLELTDEIADEYGYRFVGKAAIFVRNQFGMRSISQLLAAWLNDKKFDSKRNFYKAFYHRPDDIGEVFSIIDSFNGKRSHALVRGTADYISQLNGYSLMKYRGLGHEYNMYDIINICHPKSKTIDDFKNDRISSADTWEVNISTAKNDEERSQQWIRLVEEHKLGYMALLRNLNNILAADIPSSYWIEKELCPQLENETKIRKSLVFPYRIFTAYKNLKVKNLSVLKSLDKAFRIATTNVPHFDGLNAVVLDVSASMENNISHNSNITLKEIGACFAVSLLLSGSKIDYIKFGSDAKRFSINPLNNVFDMIEAVEANDYCGYGTNLNSALNVMKESNSYSRIFLISDMQVLADYWYVRKDTITEYAARYGNIHTYSFDLANYSSQVAPANKNFVFLTSLSDTIFKFIGFMENKEIDIVSIINNEVDF